MSTWVTLAITLLKLANALVGWLNARQMIKAGEDQVIASAAISILNETQTGKELRQYVDNMEEGEALALWDRMLEK